MKNPGKAERFVRFAAIQERRIAKTALEVVSEEEFNNALGPANTARDIEERYQEVKPEFEAIVCSKCGTKRVAASWDPLDVASMAKRVGPPLTDQILGAYSIPNLRIHATLASIRSDRSQQEEADFAFQSAFYLMLTVIDSQNEMYRLNLDDDIASLSARWMAAWRPKPEASGLGETSHDSDR